MLLGFDATTVRGNKTGVGYYTSRLLERVTRVDGEENPIDEILVLANRPLELPQIPRARVLDEGRFPLRAVWMQGVLPLLLEKERPDLCHYTNFLGPYLGRTPYVVTIHDMTLELLPRCHTWKKRILTRTLAPAIAKGARFVITPSESARRDVARLFGIPSEKIRAIPHAPDRQFRPDRDPRSLERIERRYGVRRPYLLYLGTLEPRKNLVRAIAAFSRISSRFPDYRFYLAGASGWRSKSLRRALEEVPAPSRVERLGYVAEDDLAALYSHAELFVYPSLYEGFGFPVVEAMACGTPVLTSDTSSLAEIAEGAALLVDPENVEAISEAMILGLEDEPTRACLRRAGLARASTFSWERSTRETLAVYEEALERGRVRPRARRRSFPVNGREARAVIDTVAYGALFDYPMTLEEIDRSLMGVSLSRTDISKLLAQDRTVRESIEGQPPFHFLRGNGDAVARRRAVNRLTRELVASERRAIDLVRRSPWVRMVAFSGATAHGNARDGDVDLFIVTARGRTWAVAAFLHLAMKLLRRRRTICLNYFLSEERLALEEKDVFTASQIVALQPLAGRSVLYRLVRANPWGATFFPNFWERYRELVPPLEREPVAGSLLWEWLLALGGGFLLERLGRFALRTYLRRRLRNHGAPSSVKLEPGVIKLHFKDHGAGLSKRIQSILEGPPIEPADPTVTERAHVGP